MTIASRRLLPRPEGRAAARVVLCDWCGAPVLWAVTTAGRPVAIGADPVALGEVFLVGPRPTAQVLGPRDRLRDPTTLRYTSHAPKCPADNDHANGPRPRR